MMILKEGCLSFTFPAESRVSKYDEWSFYRNQFNSAFGGTKAVDIVYADSRIAWLIEVKDYRANKRTKAIDLGDEIAQKVRDSLAGLVAAQYNANDIQEKKLAKKMLSCEEIRVVLHLEQPTQYSKLFPRAIDPSKILLKLKQLLRSIDAHPLVVDQQNFNSKLNWTVIG